ncbi:L-threonine O-3-phosphate decarboxylase [Marininema mesophilum]|uniref:threonine-phosphate decarboxylase n=1 Tax=Marininema mesophilum TaxID=1048340 RepID=A0A1H2YJE8_9BACL|nr:threonine-phosphate decarboxylase CobD [Marininema mesophilum]SDX04754.1 L-threonine O-3-phosphate decarboxylase [Marininema mesophilum]
MDGEQGAGQVVERYGHGGDSWTAGELFQREVGDFIDFSANINPLGPPAEVLQVLRELVTEMGVPGIARYPDPASRALRKALAQKYDVAEESLLIGNGAAELIDGVTRYVQPRKVGVTAPAFIEYEASARKEKAEVVYLAAGEKEDFLPKRELLLEWINSVDLAWLGHPNNPTGLFLPLSLLEAAAEEAAEAGTVLVVDEAFLDFIPDGEEKSLLPRLKEYPTTVLLRSMTKFYALPGLRLGWGVAQPELVKEIAALQVPWSVNGLAQRAGEVALANPAFEKDTWAWLQEERVFLKDGLVHLPFIEWVLGEVNYLLIKLKNLPATETSPSRWLQRKMGQRGILLRDASGYPGLGDSYVRVAVRSREENECLLTQLQGVWMEVREGLEVREETESQKGGRI